MRSCIFVHFYSFLYLVGNQSFIVSLQPFLAVPAAQMLKCRFIGTSELASFVHFDMRVVEGQVSGWPAHGSRWKSVCRVCLPTGRASDAEHVLLPSNDKSHNVWSFTLWFAQADMMPLLYLHPQPLQIAAFLFKLCHVVIAVQDCFTDMNLCRSATCQ